MHQKITVRAAWNFSSSLIDNVRSILRYAEEMSMAEYWDAFIVGFCKVDFLCYDGEPNWLGWGVVGFGTLIVLAILGVIFSD
jgi:hypothetical protein